MNLEPQLSELNLNQKLGKQEGKQDFSEQIN